MRRLERPLPHASSNHHSSQRPLQACVPFQSFHLLLSPSTQSGRYPDKRVTGLPFTARVQRGPSEFFDFPEGVSRLFFTARIERPPLYRGGSASKKNGLPAPSHHSEAARCASKKGNRLPATSFCAPLSTPSPPSLCAAPRPSLAPAPSPLRGVVAETLQQKPSYALPLS